MPIEKEDCKFCHGFWVHPDEKDYPFCSIDCRTYYQAAEQNRRQEINREIVLHEKVIAELKAKL